MASLDTDLTCAICLELFVDPCSLTCMHSYCKACIISLIKHDSSNNSTLTCPECRHVENIGTRGDYALRKNFTLANIVSKYGVHIQKDTSRQPRTKVEACFTCNDEVSTADVTHASHERTDLKSARKIVTTDIQKRILQIKQNNVAEAKEIKRQRKRIAEFRKKELSAVDTVKHEFNISLNELEQRRDSLLQDIKLHSDRVCTQEGAVQKWQEHDGKIKSTLKEIQRCESKEKFDKMKVKDLLQLRSRLNELIERAPAIHIVDSHLEFDFSSQGLPSAQTTQSPITIQRCDCIPSNNMHFASVGVCWMSDVPNSTYDVTFVSLQSKNPEYILKYSNVQSRSMLCTQLLPETEYTVTVSLHEDSKSGSEPYTFQTLPLIVCFDISFHTMHGNHHSSRYIITPDSIENFTHSGCTMSNISLTEPLMYWEVRMGSKYVKRIESDGYVFATGICLGRDIDNVSSILRNYSAYIVGLGKNSNNRLEIFCLKEGKMIKGTELPRIKGKNVIVHIGMLLDLKHKTFFVVNVESNELICQLYVIKAPHEDNQYAAIFNLTDDAGFIEIISGQQLRELPSVLSDLW